MEIRLASAAVSSPLSEKRRSVTVLWGETATELVPSPVEEPESWMPARPVLRS